jgi:hypothetical protein
MDADAEARVQRYAQREDRWGWLNVKPSDLAALLAERDGMAKIVAAAEAWFDDEGEDIAAWNRLRAAVVAWRAGEGRDGR